MVCVVCSKLHEKKLRFKEHPTYPRGRIDSSTRCFSLSLYVSIVVLFCIVACNNPVCYSIKAHINVISVLGVPWPFVRSLTRLLAHAALLSISRCLCHAIYSAWRFVCHFPLPFYVAPTWIMRRLCVCLFNSNNMNLQTHIRKKREKIWKKSTLLHSLVPTKKLSHRIQWICAAHSI